ncbi:MAG: DUF362 domain-containing protein [Nitrospirota bacterium]
MSKVTLIKGESRRKNIFESLKLLEKEIKEEIKERVILIKPNFVSVNIQKAATEVDQVRGILDFLAQFYQGRIIIAEGACGNTFEGFKNFGYFELKEEYGFKIEFLDLNRDNFEEVLISNQEKIRFSKTILDPSFFIISAAKLKVHDTVIATLSLKNLALGAVLGRDKGKVHQGIKEINHNLYFLAKKRRPDLASIDGFYGMEGEGPVIGDMVKCGVAIASLDPLAADRVGLEIMGINPEDVGYLLYCYKGRLGEYDLKKIEIVGAVLEDCKRRFKLHSRIREMLLWKEEHPPKGLGKPILYE